MLAQTYELLSAGGIGGVSIDEVSRRSGVSKTTIYRHWPSRAALLIEACSTIGSAPPVPDTGSFDGDLAALTEALAEQLRSARWAAVLPSIVDAAEREPELAGLHADLHARLMAPFGVVTERARARGELAADRGPADVTAAVAGRCSTAAGSPASRSTPRSSRAWPRTPSAVSASETRSSSEPVFDAVCGYGSGLC
ncbi:TetR/AcrR family transcriptional regulator [Amycolatopsis plumensis]|uniref:TetR/AcrR family transcriptional regulator n=1 Tax=Amycolatopsis plumensis TaxID=236508 RepID=A0ABV5UHS5_9PSEU